MVTDRALSRAGSLLQFDRGWVQFFVWHGDLWELSLLAMAVCQVTLMSADRASSRAGSLPQFDRGWAQFFVWHGDPVGAELARDGGFSGGVDVG